MSRASYARARRNGGTSAESKLRPALEKVAKKVYTNGKPVVDAVKKTAVKGLQGYLKGTNALAEKLRPAMRKLPKPSTRRHGIPRPPKR